MAKKYVLQDKYTCKYFASSFFKGLYLTDNILNALKFNTQSSANIKKLTQKLCPISSVNIVKIDIT